MKISRDPAGQPAMPACAETQTFIVRIWQERADDPSFQEHGRPRWRGTITLVGSDRQQYFFHLQGLAHFIEEQLGGAWAPRRPWWQRMMDWLRNGKQ